MASSVCYQFMMIVLTTCECDSGKRARRVREAGGCVSVHEHEHVWERLNLELAEEELHQEISLDWLFFFCFAVGDDV